MNRCRVGSGEWWDFCCPEVLTNLEGSVLWSIFLGSYLRIIRTSVRLSNDGDTEGESLMRFGNLWKYVAEVISAAGWDQGLNGDSRISATSFDRQNSQSTYQSTLRQRVSRQQTLNPQHHHHHHRLHNLSQMSRITDKTLTGCTKGKLRDVVGLPSVPGENKTYQFMHVIHVVSVYIFRVNRGPLLGVPDDADRNPSIHQSLFSSSFTNVWLHCQEFSNIWEVKKMVCRTGKLALLHWGLVGVSTSLFSLPRPTRNIHNSAALLRPSIQGLFIRSKPVHVHYINKQKLKGYDTDDDHSTRAYRSTSRTGKMHRW